MSGFKEPSFADRQKAAQQAKQNILNKFKAQPGPDDPEVKQRQAEREAQAAARAKAREAREAAKAEAEGARSRSCGRGRRPARPRKGRRGRPTGRPRGRSQGQTRCALRGPQGRQRQEEVTRSFERGYPRRKMKPPVARRVAGNQTTAWLCMPSSFFIVCLTIIPSCLHPVRHMPLDRRDTIVAGHDVVEALHRS